MKHRKYLLKTCVLLFLFVCASAATSVYAQGGPPGDIEQTVGVGLKVLARDGSIAGFNARYWSEQNFGFEGGLLLKSHWKTIPISGLYTLTHVDTDSMYIRPYVGGGINMNFFEGTDNKIGGQGFGGAEFTVKSFPKLSFGGDLGVHSFGHGSGFMVGINVLYYLK